MARATCILLMCLSLNQYSLIQEDGMREREEIFEVLKERKKL